MSANYGFTLPAHSRVWVYQADQFFTDQQLNQIHAKAEEFLQSWNSHGMDLSAEIKVIDNLFIIVAVDEQKAKASGCSIDKSVKFIRDLETMLGISLTGRTTVAYVDGNGICFKNYKDLLADMKSGDVSENVVMYNNLITTLEELSSKWKISIKDSWLSIIPA